MGRSRRTINVVVVWEERNTNLGEGVGGRLLDFGEEEEVDCGGIPRSLFGGRGLEALHQWDGSYVAQGGLVRPVKLSRCVSVVPDI